ncbi:MAG: SDR family oxidoreductase [Candidatus Competibacteraceae bacterium]
MTENPEQRRQTALITGASAGIGRELAAVFAEHGFDLVVVARRRQELETLAASLKVRHGVEVTVIALDLTTPTAPHTLFETTQRQGIEVDVLVNNAGINFYGDFKDISLENHLALIQLNIGALTALTHLYLRPMVERGHGRILNVASVSAFQSFPTIAVYAASKAFVVSLSEALSVELEGTGVTVTALCPGFTETPMLHTESVTTGHAASLPSLVVGDAAQVARDGYEACMQGEAVQVSGLLNQFSTFWMQHQPRWLGRTLGGWLKQWVS